MDWRSREFIVAADHVATCVQKATHDIDTINRTLIANWSEVVALQVFCDGGFALSGGAAAFVVTCIVSVGEGFETVVLGARGVWIEKPRSAFQTEVAALDLATEFCVNLNFNFDLNQ